MSSTIRFMQRPRKERRGGEKKEGEEEEARGIYHVVSISILRSRVGASNSWKRANPPPKNHTSEGKIRKFLVVSKNGMTTRAMETSAFFSLFFGGSPPLVSSQLVTIRKKENKSQKSKQGRASPETKLPYAASHTTGNPKK